MSPKPAAQPKPGQHKSTSKFVEHLKVIGEQREQVKVIKDKGSIERLKAHEQENEHRSKGPTSECFPLQDPPMKKSTGKKSGPHAGGLGGSPSDALPNFAALRNKNMSGGAANKSSFQRYRPPQYATFSTGSRRASTATNRAIIPSAQHYFTSTPPASPRGGVDSRSSSKDAPIMDTFGSGSPADQQLGVGRTATWRQGCLGEHYVATSFGEIIRQSSNVSMEKARLGEYGGGYIGIPMFWCKRIEESKSGKGEPENCIVYDFSKKVNLSEVNVLLAGYANPLSKESYNPKCISISYCSDDKLDESERCCWMPAKRVYVGAEWRFCQLAWRCEEAARYWRIEFPVHWGGAEADDCNVNTAGGIGAAKFFGVLDVQFIAEDPDSRNQPNGFRPGNVPMGSVSRMASQFDTASNLTAEQLEIRAAAKTLGLPLHEADQIKSKFEKFDTDGSGFIEKDEFACILQCFMGGGVKAEDISAERFDAYWREVDSDNSGQIDYFEFLAWYQSVSKAGGLNPESFYATFGTQRIKRQAECAAGEEK